MRIARLSLWIALVYGEQLVHHSTMDTCAMLKGANLFTKLNLPIDEAPNRGFLAEACVCLSNAQKVAQTNPVAVAAVDKVGNVAVTAALQGLILGTTPTWDCVYSANAVPLPPTCDNNDPCPFTCTNGYTVKGEQCVCLPPMKVQTDGHCRDAQREKRGDHDHDGPPHGDPPHGNPPWQSHYPGGPGHHPRSLMGILTTENCPFGFSLCGNPLAKTGSESWECLDTQTTLDSCGGCTTPFMYDTNPSTAVDCTAIPGVEAVDCVGGKCLVSRCARGWMVAQNGQECKRF